VGRPAPPLLPADDPATVETRAAVESALRELRDALHRRGRLASRQDALDEISRLLFAHVVAQLDGNDGIATAALAARPEPTLAARLVGFVAEAHRRHLPESLAVEVPAGDLALRLKPEEEALAAEIVAVFERLHVVEAATVDGGGPGTDVLNEVFGTFLADSFLDEKELGQYLTPVEVVRYMVGLALGALDEDERQALGSPSAAEDFGTILDPSCGVGSFLTELVRVAGSRCAPTDELTEWRRMMCRDVVAGIDKSERMVRLALANMALFRFPAARLHLANALTRTGPEGEVARSFDGTVGLILSNPPFGARFSGADLDGYRIAHEWAHRPPAAVDSELLFLERYLDWLRPGGQLVTVVPDSILTNKGLFGDLRRGLASVVELVSVTSLPPVTFAAAGTSTKTSVLQLRKRSGRGSRVRTRFAICHDVGYSVVTRGSRRLKVPTGGGELPALLASVLDRRRPSHAAVADAPRWDATFHASMPLAVQQRVDAPRPDDVRLGDLAVVCTERVDPRRGGERTFAYIEISDVDGPSLLASAHQVPRERAPTRARKPVRAGDVLVSTVRPERRAVAVVRPEQDGAVATTGFAVLRPTGIHPVLLARLLQSDFVTVQLLRNNVGVAYPAIDETCLPAVLLPISKADLAELDAAADDVLDAEAHLAQARGALADQLEALVARWEQGGERPQT
jgi:SAM-dependent methyltransferase